MGGLLIALAFAVAFSFDSPLVLDVAPKVGRAPADLRIRTRIWPSDKNRAIVLQILSADGDEYSGGTELDGSEPIQHTLWYRGVAAGQYDVLVCLFRTDKKFCQSASVLVAP